MLVLMMVILSGGIGWFFQGVDDVVVVIGWLWNSSRKVISIISVMLVGNNQICCQFGFVVVVKCFIIVLDRKVLINMFMLQVVRVMKFCVLLCVVGLVCVLVQIWLVMKKKLQQMLCSMMLIISSGKLLFVLLKVNRVQCIIQVVMLIVSMVFIFSCMNRNGMVSISSILDIWFSDCRLVVFCMFRLLRYGLVKLQQNDNGMQMVMEVRKNIRQVCDFSSCNEFSFRICFSLVLCCCVSGGVCGRVNVYRFSISDVVVVIWKVCLS